MDGLRANAVGFRFDLCWYRTGCWFEGGGSKGLMELNDLLGCCTNKLEFGAELPLVRILLLLGSALSRCLLRLPRVVSKKAGELHPFIPRGMPLKLEAAAAAAGLPATGRQC